MTRVVISDTLPVRALAHLGYLDWPSTMFGQLFVPPAVVSELEFPPKPLHAVVTRQYPFLVVASPTNTRAVPF